MKLLRKILHLDDEGAKTRALEADREIQEARESLKSKLDEIEQRAQQQSLHAMIKRNDPLFVQWGGAMDILRGRE